MDKQMLIGTIWGYIIFFGVCTIGSFLLGIKWCMTNNNNQDELCNQCKTCKKMSVCFDCVYNNKDYVCESYESQQKGKK